MKNNNWSIYKYNTGFYALKYNEVKWKAVSNKWYYTNVPSYNNIKDSGKYIGKLEHLNLFPLIFPEHVL